MFIATMSINSFGQSRCINVTDPIALVTNGEHTILSIHAASGSVQRNTSFERMSSKGNITEATSYQNATTRQNIYSRTVVFSPSNNSATLNSTFGSNINGIQSMALRFSRNQGNNSVTVSGSVNNKPIKPFVINKETGSMEGNKLQFQDGSSFSVGQTNPSLIESIKAVDRITQMNCQTFITNIGKLNLMPCWLCFALTATAEVACLVACPAAGPAAPLCWAGCVAAAVLAYDACCK